MRLIDGAEACFATASGMCAVFTALGALLPAGSRLVAARSLFGSCFVVCNEILPRWGVETVFVDGDDLDQWEQALSVRPTRCSSRPRRTRCSRSSTCPGWSSSRTPPAQRSCWTTCSPRRCCSAASISAPTWSSTPAPSTSMGRAACSAARFSAARTTSRVRSRNLMRHTGPALSPFNAWTLLKGLETMPLRVRHSTVGSALKIAQFLEEHPAVRWIEVPVLGVAPAVRPRDAADVAAAAPSSRSSSTRPRTREEARLRVPRRAAHRRHLEQPRRRQVADHPSRHHHPPRDGPGGRAAIGITDGVVRLSVGLEDVADLLDDLDQAL